MTKNIICSGRRNGMQKGKLHEKNFLKKRVSFGQSERER